MLNIYLENKARIYFDTVNLYAKYLNNRNILVFFM